MFIQNNQEFVCLACKKKIGKHPTSSRNHCTYCLYSQHVDISPGDRKNTCYGLQKPIGLEMKSGKTQIVFVCTKCGQMGKNIVASDDNQDLLIKLSTERII